jgi:hypothetical protein
VGPSAQRSHRQKRKTSWWGKSSDELKERTRAFAQEQYKKSRSTAEAVLDKVHQKVKESSQSLMGRPSIVPSGAEGEIRELQKPVRPERIELRDRQSWRIAVASSRRYRPHPAIVIELMDRGGFR